MQILSPPTTLVQESDIPVEVKPGQFVAKKSKAAAKKGPGNTQWAILKMSGIPEADIPKFRCGFGSHVQAAADWTPARKRALPV